MRFLITWACGWVIFQMFNQNLPHNFLKQRAGLCGLSVPCLCIFRCSESKLFSIVDFLTWRVDSYKTMHFKYTCTERKQDVPSASGSEWITNINTKMPLVYTFILFFQNSFVFTQMLRDYKGWESVYHWEPKLTWGLLGKDLWCSLLAVFL